MKTLTTALALCLSGAGSATAAPAEPDKQPEPKRYHELQVGMGASDAGAFMMFSWTGKRRVGVYFKPHLLDDDKPIRANSTVVEESASEVGLTVRAHRAVTLGIGYGTFERDTSVYGAPTIIFGIPALLEEREERDTGLAGAILFGPGHREGKKLGFSFAVSRGPAGVGASVQLSVRTGR